MTAHKPDQDDFDPALDEASDDFSYEEEAFGDEESVEGESWDENSDEGGDDSAEEESQTPARKKKKGGFFSMILILVAVLGGGAFIYLKVFSGVPTKPGPAVVANVPETSAQQGPSDTLAPPADPVIADAATTAEVPQNVVADEPLLPTPDDMTLVAVPEIAPEITPELAADPEMLAAELTPTEQQPVEVATAPPMPAPIAAPEESDGFAAGLPSANDIMLAPRPVVAVEATPAGLSDDAAKGIEEKVWPLVEAGKIKPVIDSTFPLAKAAEAHARMESSAHIGKIVLTV